MPSYTGTSGNDSVTIVGNQYDEYIGTLGNDNITLVPEFDIGFDYRSFSSDFVMTINGQTGITVNKGGQGIDTISLASEPQNSWASIKFGSGNDQVTITGNVALAMDGGQGNDTFEVVPSNDDPSMRVEYHRGATAGITYTSNNGSKVSGTVTTSHAGTDTLINVTSIRGTDFADTFNGGDGDEIFLPRGGNDVINGGSGFDTVRYNRSGVTSGVTVDLQAGTAIGDFNNTAFSQTLSGIEVILGSSHNDDIAGSDQGDGLLGFDGNDVIHGRGGNDSLNGGNGDDIIDGGAGNDQIWDEGGNDTIYSGGGHDQIYNGAGNDTTYLQGGGDIYYRAGEGQDQIIIQSTGFYQLDYQEYMTALTFAIQDQSTTITYTGTSNVADQVTGTDNIDYANDDGDINYRGTNFNDTFNISLGGHAYTTIYHSGGNDIINNQGSAFVRADYRLSIDDQNSTGITYNSNNGPAVSGTVSTGKGDSDTLSNVGELRGTTSADTFNGGDGNERFITEGGNDVINGGGGIDTLRYDRNGMDAVNVNFLAGTATGTYNGVAFTQTISGLEQVRGSRTGDDMISGANGDERFEGKGGNDTLLGLGGNDRLEGDEGNDILDGGLGDDEINGGEGNDTVYTGGGDDYVRGSTGNDTYHLVGNHNSPGGSAQQEDYVHMDYEDLNAPINVSITGNGVAPTVTIDKGANGTDTVQGLNAFQHVSGGFAVEGTDGDDTFSVTSNMVGFVSFRGGRGNDTITGDGDATIRADYKSSQSGITYTGGAATQNPNSQDWDLMNGTVTGSDVGTDTLTQVDRIRGTDFADVFNGGASNDFFEGLGGNDQFNGGTGNELDVVRYYSRHNDGITADLDAGTITGSYKGQAFTHNVTSIEGVDGSRNSDTIRGNASDNIFNGRQGDDIFEGRGGNDRIIGEDGDDTAIFSGAASNIYRYGNAVFVDGPDGRDSLMNVETLNFGAGGIVLMNDLASRNPWDYLASNMNLVSDVGLNEESIIEHMFDKGFRQGLELDSFDEYAYFISHADLKTAFNGDVSKAAEHYVRYGHSEGRKITFDGLQYIASNADLIGAFGLNREAGSAHYLSHGQQEGRKNDFEGLEYIASNQDLIGVYGTNAEGATAHYIQYGHGEGRKVTFDGLNYIASHADLISSLGANREAGAEHFILEGKAAGRGVTFNAFEYLASHADVAGVFGTNAAAAATHYIEAGHGEGRTVTFDSYEYLAANKDVLQVLGANRDVAAQHYITNGRGEGRATEFDGLAYVASYGDLITAFGTDEDAAIAHFVEFGATEGREVTFDARLYLGGYADLRDQYGTDLNAATQHYIQTGHSSQSYEANAFEALEYIASYGDLIGAFGTDGDAAMAHYLNHGFAEGRGDTFDPQAYLNATGNGDLATAYGTNYEAATLHYIQWGFDEGRAVS